MSMCYIFVAKKMHFSSPLRTAGGFEETQANSARAVHARHVTDLVAEVSRTAFSPPPLKTFSFFGRSRGGGGRRLK